jgi:hypothetical protein
MHKAMQVELASRRSPLTAVNHDFVIATSSVVVVVDGQPVSPSLETGCVHDGQWFVCQLGTELIRLATSKVGTALTESLSQAIVNVNALHPACRLSNPGIASAAVAILRERDDTIDYLIVGDTTILIDEPSGLQVVTDKPIVKSVRQQGAQEPHDVLAIDQMASPVGQGRHRDSMVRAPVVATNPDIAEDALTGTLTRKGLGRAAVLSKGVGRLIDSIGLMGWPGLLDLLDREGPEALINRVRVAEESGPNRRPWSPDNMPEDATAVYLSFSRPVRKNSDEMAP